MRLIDRLYQYLEYKDITAYAFERTCEIANGYLKKQYNGKGSIGSDILDKIHKYYPDLDALWLLTGEGKMIVQDTVVNANENDKKYLTIKDQMIALLRQQVSVMEKNMADKEKIIKLLEEKLQKPKNKKAPA